MKKELKILILGSLMLSAMPVHAVETESIVLAGGCFWGMELVFDYTKGVTEAVVGYAGGSANTAQYEAVSTGTTGHAESVKVTYDPQQISLPQILDIYFRVAHDPTELNYQGPDHGTQYRSAVFFRSPDQRKMVQDKIDALNAEHVFTNPIVTKLELLKGFYLAEDYHQHYAEKHPLSSYILIEDAPKAAKLKSVFPALYK